MIKKISVVILLAFLIFSESNVLATDFSSTNFTVKDPVIKPGAGFATSSSFRLWSSFGQEAIGSSSASTFILKAGFLYFPEPTITTTTPTSTPPTITVIGGGGGGGGLATTTTAKSKKTCDFNNDGHCNIIDFSILLYYFGKPMTIAERYDLNEDNKIDLIDVSILFYYWD